MVLQFLITIESTIPLVFDYTILPLLVLVVEPVSCFQTLLIYVLKIHFHFIIQFAVKKVWRKSCVICWKHKVELKTTATPLKHRRRAGF